MTRSEHIHALLEEYARQRTENELAQQRRTREAYKKAPRIEALRGESASLALSAIRTILDNESEEQRIAVAQNMKKRGVEINAEIRGELRAAGLPEDYLEMRYRCPVCRDTAYVGEAPARFCDCFESQLRLRLYEDGSMVGVDEQNFSKFNPEIIPEADGQRDQAIRARDFCLKYAESFPNTDYRNLLLTGEGGLGKTFLLNCIFERVTSRGFSAIRITAFRMLEAMRQQHFSNDEKYRGFSDLIEVPLLLIDDLGSEPILRNISVEYLFTLLNERNAARRHTVVATNLTPAYLKERYGERVASRLLDRTLCGAILFKGKDLRRR